MKKEEKLVNKSLGYSTKDGSFYTVTVNSANNFVSPYAVALNASNFQLGLLSALPTFIPVELFTSDLMKKFSRKKIVLFSVFTEIILLVLMAFIGILSLRYPSFSSSSAFTLIALFTIYISMGLLAAPAWASWMKELTNNVKLGDYFGKRNKIFGLIGLATTLLAGLFLDFFKSNGKIFIGFAILFLIAAITRSISRYYLSRQYEPKFKVSKRYYFSFWQFLKKAPHNNYGKFTIFMALLVFSVNIAAPFFTPYMINDLKFNYFTYTLVNLVIVAIATLATMPLWGKFIDRYGCINAMRVVIWALPTIPILWVISSNIYWLIFAQILSGVAWAGFNLAAGTFTYHAVTKQRMCLCSAYSSILNGFAIFSGAIIGGIIASFNITFMNIFLFVFLVSAIARIIVVSSMFSLIQEVRPVEHMGSLFEIIIKPFKAIHLNLIYPNIGAPSKEKV